MWRRFIVLGVLACAVGMFASAPAFAASPQQVYRDYADNGRLDHQYSKADLQRALKYAALQALGAEAVKTNGGLPFTGLDLGLMAAGGAVLLVAGASMRKLGTTRK